MNFADERQRAVKMGVPGDRTNSEDASGGQRGTRGKQGLMKQGQDQRGE